MDQTPDDFNDPALKAALQRLQGGHVTRADLRERIASALERERAGKGHRRPPMGLLYAAAACLLLAAGGSWYLYQQGAPEREQQRYLADNRELVDKMITADRIPAAGATITAPSTQPAAKDWQEAVTGLSGIAVPSPDLSAAGWTLVSGAKIMIDDRPAARFVYRQGDRKMMLISMPYGYFSGAPQRGGDYHFVENGCPLAGFVKECVLSCIVGDSTMTLPEAEALRDRVRQQ